MTPREKEIRAAELEAEAVKLRAEAEKEREKKQPTSPRTKLPVADPESQAVERARYEMGMSYNSAPMTEAELAALLKEDKKKDNSS